ncbi:MAG: hypothetical protein AAB445_01485 [Patescibacteria group bacterium]
MNGATFPQNVGVQKLRNPYTLNGIAYKTEEEFWLAELLTNQEIIFYYELINFPGWRPDVVLRFKHLWNGTPYKGSRVWGFEVKGQSPLRPKWIERSVGLWKAYKIPILVLSRSDIARYYKRGRLPLQLIN